MRVLAALGLVLIAAPAAAAAPILSPGCEGELCYDRGIWTAKRALPLFARIGDRRPIGTIPRGMRVTALGGRIVTTRAGAAVIAKGGLYLRGYGGKGPPVRLARGERVRLLHAEGEGFVAAMTAKGSRVSLGEGDYRLLTPFAATDWVRLRLSDGRTGWTNVRADFHCSSHMDDAPGQCRGAGGPG